MIYWVFLLIHLRSMVLCQSSNVVRECLAWSKGTGGWWERYHQVATSISCDNDRSLFITATCISHLPRFIQKSCLEDMESRTFPGQARYLPFVGRPLDGTVIIDEIPHHEVKLRWIKLERQCFWVTIFGMQTLLYGAWDWCTWRKHY